jgi:hypothetical protein
VDLMMYRGPSKDLQMVRPETEKQNFRTLGDRLLTPPVQ